MKKDPDAVIKPFSIHTVGHSFQAPFKLHLIIIIIFFHYQFNIPIHYFDDQQ